MEWGYESPRRGSLPPDEHEMTGEEYRTLPRPYAFAREYAHYKAVYSGLGSPYTKGLLTDERKMPYAGTPYMWARVRALGGKTLVWGRVALRLSDYDFKCKTHDGFGEDWPISYADLGAVLRQGRYAAGHLGYQGEPAAAAGRHLSAADQADLRRADPPQGDRADGAASHPGPRRGDDRRPRHQPLPIALHGPRALRPRLRHLGGLPFAHRAYLSREGHGTSGCPDGFDRRRSPGR